MIVDLFAGAGGWGEGLKNLGLDSCAGIDLDSTACETARTAGHIRERDDVANLDPTQFRDEHGEIVTGLIASPPCGSFSYAGRQMGSMHDVRRVVEAAEKIARGENPRLDFVDERSALMVQPIRWAIALWPRWIALEQVPAVLGIWREFGEILARAGYSVATGLIGAEQFGVAQTRTRAFLIANAEQQVAMPVPTHSAYNWRYPSRRSSDLLAPWVSMAEVLGIDERDYVGLLKAPSKPTDGLVVVNGSSYQRRALRRGSEPAMTLTTKSSSTRHLAWPLYGYDRLLTVAQASVLMGFREDYPWQGSVSAQFRQLANAVCPPVGAAVLRAASGLCL